MPSWSHKRQLLILLIPLVLVCIGGYLTYTKYIYKAPSCFDGIQNGTETGVDCGGTCSLLCSSDTLPPVVLWSKSFQVTNGVWNAVAYVQNPNSRSSAKQVPYEFKLYDANNKLIVNRDGVIDIAPHKTFAVFEGGINTQGKIVKRTDFQFTQNGVRTVDTSSEPDVTITNSTIENGSTSPRIDGNITNPNLQKISPTELIALILDGKGNAIDASKTVIDPLDAGQTMPFVFTWPRPFTLGQDICQSPSAVMLVLDRSGSMQSDGKNPPQPLTEVKNTAIDFLNQLHPGDLVGVVSFATSASQPIDEPLFGDFNLVSSAISAISVSASTTDQNTNIGDGINQARTQLDGVTDTTVKKVIILLTDGDPTDPKQVGVANYPTLFAEQSALAARNDGIQIYTIGLGQQSNSNVLTTIAGSSSQFFSAPDTSTLSRIYSTIANSICVRKPNVIEIISRSLTN